MSKTKLQIKNRMGEVLFEHEREYNTLGITLGEAVRKKADLSGADLSGANLRGANLSGANLRGADLSGANLSGANLSGANLFKANLSEADLRGADLSGANLFKANLWGADLSGANLLKSVIKDILIVGNIGSRRSYTIIYDTDEGIMIQCGCFFGDEKEFVAEVAEKHGNNKHARDYLAMLDFAKVRFGMKYKKNSSAFLERLKFWKN